MKITVTILDEKLDGFLEGFIAVVPKPEQHTGLTDQQFFKSWIKDVVFATYKTGRIEVARAKTEPDVDLNIVEVE